MYDGAKLTKSLRISYDNLNSMKWSRLYILLIFINSQIQKYLIYYVRYFIYRFIVRLVTIAATTSP